MSDKIHNFLQREADHAYRINELRNMIKFLVEYGMYNEAVRSRQTFKTALAIADEQRELEPSTMPLWKRPKEPR